MGSMVRSVKWRKVLLVLAIVVAVGGVGGAATALLSYHEATKIDRSNPKVVLDEYLRAVLVRKDAVGAELYSCDAPSGLASITALREELNQREQDYSVEILVSWGAVTRVDGSGRSELTTDLHVTAIKDGVEQSNSSQGWRFSLLDQDGWRVCNSERLPRPTPSPSLAR